MSQAPTAEQLQQRLQQVLQPSQLEVIDESHQHHGHAGANGTGFGTQPPRRWRKTWPSSMAKPFP
jgi:BolA protein